MNARRSRWSLVGTVAALLLLLPPAATAATSAPSTPPPDAAAQRLADRYAPIVMVRKEEDPPCDTTGEQYEPTTVDITLGNPTVTLDRGGPGKRETPIRRAPTAADIAGLDADHYLNLEGSPLGDTCVYARAFRKIKRDGRAPAVTYAHIAREKGYPGFVLQFFFYWYFNQFNDLHESDWEGMQLGFDAADPAAALRDGVAPSKMILFQHAGGEQADWDDAKVQKEGTHPIVYPGAGSHATFYDSAVYVENGEHGSGLGCDDTSAPLREVRPQPVLLPDRVTDTGEFAWLSYYGHWGQKESGFNDGPTGPQTKHEWKHPWSWMEDQRRSSNRMPGGTVAGPQITDAFCATVAGVSDLVNLDAKSPAEAIATLAVIAALVLLFVGFTRWGPIDLRELRARRAFGQLVRAARQLYGRHWRPLLLIAAIAIPIVGGAQYLVGVISAGPSGAWEAVGDGLNTLSRPVAMAIVSAVVIVFVRSLVLTGKAGFTDSWRGMLARFWRVVLAELAVTVMLLVLLATIVGIPLALWKLVDWAFVQQRILFEDSSVRRAFRESSRLVRGRWWHTARAVLFFNVIGLVVGPVLTFALIFTALPLLWINLLGSLIFALLIPYTALGETLLYFDVEARAAAEPAKNRRGFSTFLPPLGRNVENARGSGGSI